MTTGLADRLQVQLSLFGYIIVAQKLALTLL